MKHRLLISLAAVWTAASAFGAATGADAPERASADRLRSEWAKSAVFEGECHWSLHVPRTAVPSTPLLPGNQVTVAYGGKPLVPVARVLDELIMEWKEEE